MENYWQGQIFLNKGVLSSKQQILIRIYFENLCSCMSSHYKFECPPGVGEDVSDVKWWNSRLCGKAISRRLDLALENAFNEFDALHWFRN